jgi:hypothetical protein
MSSLLPNLRETNRRLSVRLDGIVVKQGQTELTTPEHIAGLLSELLRAGAWLRAETLPANGTDPGLEEELKTYRHNVERLRELMPFVHRHLLAERARIEARRTQLRSAAEWVRASRQTL